MNRSDYNPPQSALDESRPTRSRNPFVAGGLGALVPGLGHLYLGRRRIALSLFVFALLLVGGSVPLFVRLGASNLTTYAVIMAFLTCAWLAQAGHAFALARHIEDYTLRRTNHLPTYVLFGALFAAAFLLLTSAQHAYIADFYTVSNEAMAPTLWPGDRLFVSKLGTDHLAYGDVVLYRHHYDAASTAFNTEVGRVIGLEGDVLDAVDGVWYRNDDVISTREIGPVETVRRNLGGEWTREKLVAFEREEGGERYRVARRVDWEERQHRDTFDTVEVPPGHVFIVADNLEGAWDSRAYGPIRQTQVIGFPRLIWGSGRPEHLTGDRIGLRVR